MLNIAVYGQHIVAGIEFGKTSYEEACPKLKYKFGEPVMESDDDRMIIFANIEYTGLKFDRAWFMFESSTTHNVFNKCWLISNFRTAKEAKDFRERIVEKLGDKYEITSQINSETKFKDYSVGVSPTDSAKPYFIIQTFKMSENQYSTSICYGPFDYINEEF